MPRRPRDLCDSRVTVCLLAALARLHARGRIAAGPLEIGREAASQYGKPVVSTLASHYLRRLAEEGKVERIPQGQRRGHYRLVEEA